MSQIVSFPPKPALLSENLKRLKIPHSGNRQSLSSVSIPLTHVTTTDRIESILTSGKILSIYNQEKKGIRYNSLDVNTDVLDRKYGFDKYVFTTLGRTAFHNGGNIALVFRPEDIMNREGVIGSLKEVSDYGALVSKEAESIFSLTTGGNSAQRNRIALTHFFDNIIRGSDFERVFFWFLTNHFQDYAKYLSTLVYPGETLGINPMGTMNVWGGPQIMIPREVSLEDCKGILVRTHAEYEYVMSILNKQGVGIPVSSLQSFLASFGNNSRLPDELTDNFIIAMNVFTSEFFEKYRA